VSKSSVWEVEHFLREISYLRKTFMREVLVLALAKFLTVLQSGCSDQYIFEYITGDTVRSTYSLLYAICRLVGYVCDNITGDPVVGNV